MPVSWGEGHARGASTFSRIAGITCSARCPSISSSGLTITDAPDGAALLTGIAHGGTDALIAEILRWRRHAEVLGGPELRARMAEEVRELAGMYAGSGGDTEAADVFTEK